MYRPLIGLMLLLSLAHPGTLYAHTRSESFSHWHYAEQTLRLRFTVSAREVTRITHLQGAQALQGVLAKYLDNHIVVSAPDPDCKLAGAMKPLSAQTGFLQIEATWHCSKPPTALGIHAFFDLAAEHSHFATFESPAGLSQRLMTREDTVWLLSTTSADDNPQVVGSGFIDYVLYGIRHISSGLDHIVFLLALLLICRKTSDMLWAVTGFTLGHSITLTLAAVGIVHANIPAVEAIIGLTIALLMIERTANSMNSALPLAIACALLLLLMALLAPAAGENLGVMTLSGLALFSFCYLLMAHELGGRGSYLVLITALFGMVHGLGFAGAFLASNVGVEVLPLSLAGFNIGVELGQLVLLAMMLTVGLLVKGQTRYAAPAADLLSAVVCGFGTFWLIQRSFL
jgi:hypothetical protein